MYSRNDVMTVYAKMYKFWYNKYWYVHSVSDGKSVTDNNEQTRLYADIYMWQPAYTCYLYIMKLTALLFHQIM